MKLRTFLSAVLTAVILTLDRSAAATLISNAFAGANVSPTTLTAEAGVLFGDTVSGPIGPSWSGTVSLPAGVLYDLTLEIDGTAGTQTIIGSGLAGLLGSISSSKTFGGVLLADSQTYEISLTRALSADVSLLSSLTIILGIDDGGERTPLVNTATGLGIGGLPLDILGLLSSNETASFQFTTADISNLAPVYFEVTLTTLASLANQSVTLTDLSVVAVPEPATWVLLAAGLIFGFCVISFRRQSWK